MWQQALRCQPRQCMGACMRGRRVHAAGHSWNADVCLLAYLLKAREITCRRMLVQQAQGVHLSDALGVVHLVPHVLPQTVAA